MDRSIRRESVQETAASWHDQLNRENVPDETRAAFARWLAQSPQHRTAFEEVDRTWSTLESVAHDPQILALRHETALRLTRTTSSSTRALKWSVAATFLIVLVSALVLLGARSDIGSVQLTALLDLFRGVSQHRYVTATGERLSITLQDGSQLTLNTQTELAVAFTRAERTVRLARGQAIFEVARNPHRPFVVEAQNRRVIALGTAFDVRLDGRRIDVTMIEGTVRVEPSPVEAGASLADRSRPPAAAPLAVATVTQGEQFTADSHRQTHIRRADPQQVTSWRRGQVIFEDTRLADAVAELNRYSETKIELADPALAALRLSGGFATGRPMGFVEAVTAYFPVRVERADERVIVLAPSDAPSSVF